jgi:predicted small integral membrane protein
VILRTAKISLVSAVALYYSLVVFNNLTDYNSNFQYIRHVLMMDSTFPGNAGIWRASNSPALHTIFYVAIILWESAIMILCWWGAARLATNLRASAASFHRAKGVAIAALTLGLLMSLVAFLTVGGEWFLMWQSKTWSGQDPAFRMFTVIALVLLLVVLPDSEDQP